MGDIADYYADLAMVAEFEHERIDLYYNDIYFKDLFSTHLKGKLKWVTKDGQQILIKDMTDQHLYHSRKWLDKVNLTWAFEMRDVLDMEINKRHKEITITKEKLVSLVNNWAMAEVPLESILKFLNK